MFHHALRAQAVAIGLWNLSIRTFHVSLLVVQYFSIMLQLSNILGHLLFSEMHASSCCFSKMTGFHFWPTNAMFFEQQTASKKCSKGKHGRVEMGS